MKAIRIHNFGSAAEVFQYEEVPIPEPGSDELLFSSTHADPKSKQWQDEELAFRASGKERRYSWDYDPEMDIYAYSEKTGTLNFFAAR